MRQRFKGYMTLEASLIVPMVICVFALLIYFTNYMYARCILSQDCYLLAFRAADDREEAINEKKYFGNIKPSFETSDKAGKKIKVIGRTETRHGAMGNYFLKPAGSWQLEASFTAKKRDYPGHVRMLKRLRDIGEEIIVKE